jgi:hypothetical protein
MSSTPIHRLAVLVRLLRRSVAFACVALLLLMGPSANAGSINVLQYTQVDPNVGMVSAVDNGNGTTTLTASVPVIITIYLGVSEPPGGILATETFTNVVSTAAAGVDPISGEIYQAFSGTISFTAGAYNYLTATFSKGMMFAPTVSGSGESASLVASTPNNNLSFTATDVTFGGPTSMSLSFSGVSPPLSIDSTHGPTISSFSANHTGTFNAGSVTSVPEPGTFFMASIAVVVGTLVYRRKKRMNE